MGKVMQVGRGFSSGEDQLGVLSVKMGRRSTETHCTCCCNDALCGCLRQKKRIITSSVISFSSMHHTTPSLSLMLPFPILSQNHKFCCGYTQSAENHVIALNQQWNMQCWNIITNKLPRNPALKTTLACSAN